MVARQPERLFQSGEYFPCLIGKGNMLVAIRQPCDEGFLPLDTGFRLGDSRRACEIGSSVRLIAASCVSFSGF